MRLGRAIAVALLALAWSPVMIAQQHHVTLAPDAIVWQPLPREWIVGTLPKGVELKGQIAIIHGDPNKPGSPFIIRIKSSGNSVLPVHWHKFDEHVTVLTGVWCVGTGDKIDPGACTDMPAGSYIFLPRLMHHWAITKDNIVEVHGIGPFRAYLVQSPGK